MQKDTLEIIEELRENYSVRIENDREFRIDDYLFSEYKDKLLVSYSVKRDVDDIRDYEEEIYKSVDEVAWWVNSGRDY